MENTYLQKLIFLAKEHALPHAIIIESKNFASVKDYLIEFLKNAMCKENIKKPCEECSDCIKIKAGFHPDVKFIEPEKDSKSIKIESIRNIREDAYIISNEGGYKFYIITNGELLTTQAQNAFIKILEEPPKNVVFIICTEFLSALISTIRSRCQIFKFLENEDVCNDVENLAKDFTKAVLNDDKIEILSLSGKIPNDRIFFKQFINKVLEFLIKNCNSDFLKENIVEKIDVLKNILEMSEKNVNFNLLVCTLCAKI